MMNAKRLLAILLLLALGGCIGPLALECRGTQERKPVAELLFGRKIGGRVAVSEAAWSRFVDAEIVPRFPDGLSVIDAAGRWRNRETNVVIREPSKIVLIAMRGEAEDQQRIDAIVEAYKRQFRQQSVGVIVRPACVSF